MNKKVKEKKEKLTRGSKEGPSSYMAAIVVHIVLIYVFNNLQHWFGIFNSSFNPVLWLFNISFAANIVVNVIYLIYDKDWFKNISHLALNLYSLIIIYTTIIIFPFNMNQANANIANTVLYIAFFATIIAVLVETVKLVYNLIQLGGESINEK